MGGGRPPASVSGRREGGIPLNLTADLPQSGQWMARAWQHLPGGVSSDVRLGGPDMTWTATGMW